MHQLRFLGRAACCCVARHQLCPLLCYLKACTGTGTSRPHLAPVLYSEQSEVMYQQQGRCVYGFSFLFMLTGLRSRGIATPCSWDGGCQRGLLCAQ